MSGVSLECFKDKIDPDTIYTLSKAKHSYLLKEPLKEGLEKPFKDWVNSDYDGCEWGHNEDFSVLTFAPMIEIETKGESIFFPTLWSLKIKE